MLSYAGSFAFYSFVSPTLLQIAGASVEIISLTLLAYGFGAALGNVLGGRLTDSQGMDRASVILLFGIMLSLGLIAFSLHQSATMIGLVALLGFTTYGVIPPLQSRLLMLAERHRPQTMDVASGMNIAAFNTGVMAGSGIGGVAIHVWGLQSLAPIGTGITAISIFALVCQLTLPSMRALTRTTKVAHVQEEP
nr:MFS transporter [Acidithiobacillus ferrianus]